MTLQSALNALLDQEAQMEINKYDEIEKQLIFAIGDLNRTCNSMAQIQDASAIPFAMPMDRLYELYDIIGTAICKHSVVGETYPDRSKASPQIDGDPFRQVVDAEQHLEEAELQSRCDEVAAERARGE